MAPTVFAVYTLAASRATVAAVRVTTASASGNVAPSATVAGRRSRPTVKACATTIRLNTTSGSATCPATASGSRDAAYHAATTEATPLTTSIAASHTRGRF